MKKGLIFATTLAMALGVGVAVGAHQQKAVKAEAVAAGETVYLLPSSDWKKDNAWFAMYTYGGSAGETWTKLNPVTGDTDYYSATVPANSPSVIFTRMNPASEDMGWGNKWNQTGDLSFQADKNLYSVEGWSGGSWGTYTPTLDPVFHLLGSFNSWSDDNDEYLLTVDAQDANHYTIAGVVLEAEDELKVKDTANDVWYGNKGENVPVGESGTYNIDFYKSADNDEHIVLNKQETPITYSVKYGSDYYEFTLDDEHKPEGADHQYKATINNPYIWRARELEFYADETKITSNIGVDYNMEEGKPVEGNNIVGDVTNGFKVYTSNNGMDVYMKQYGEWFSLWGTEYAENSYSISRVFTNLNLDTDFEPYGDYVKQYKSSSAVNLTKLAEADEKYYISENAGHGMQALNMETAGHNNAVAVTGSYFNVHNDCSEVVYLKMKADLSLWLYIDGYVEAHVLTIGGKTVNLSDNGDGQYVAHGVALSAGDTVTSYTIEGEAQDVSSKKVANNNLFENMKVVADVASADIYYNVENKTLWISGLPEGGQHILKNGHTLIEMNPAGEYEGYEQYASGMLTFAANDTIKLVNTGVENSYADVWCPDIIKTSPALEGKFVYDSENDQMKCVEACSAAVYLKIKYGVDEVYFGDVPEYVTEAVDYVEGFKTAMAGACSAQGKQAAVEAAWALQATAFEGLSAEAKAEVKLGGYSLVEEIQEFGERYMAIQQQHPTWDLDNFLEWEIPSNPRFSGLETTVEMENSGLVIAIIAIAATSAAALGVLLVLKKRKHN